MNNNTFAVVDLETTGHSPVKGDRIIQIAIVFINDGIVGEKYVRFVNPGQKIPEFIKQLTSISDEDVSTAPYFEEIADEVSNLLQGSVFVAHNTDFDLSFLQNEFIRCGVPKWSGKKIDTVEFSKILFPTAHSYRLQEITEQLGIPLATAHRADEDAEATAHLFLTCVNKLYTLPEETLKLLHKRSFRLKTDLSLILYDALKIARTSQKKEDFHHFRGIPYHQEPIVETAYSDLNTYPFDEKEKEKLLKLAFPKFEARKSQFQFMDEVWASLTNSKEIIVEVPTGVGKTMAYLLPAVLFSMTTEKPIIISTYTNHLVDKIMQEELIKITKMLGTNISTTVLKGRDRYISLNKFEELLHMYDETYDEAFTIMQILVWLTTTNTGDLDELNVSGGGQLFIDRVRKRTNRLTSDEEGVDFHSRLIESSIHSNLIVTNHSMLLSDLNRDQKLFENFAGVIIDEAHQFLQTATRTNEIVFSYTNWKYVMGQIISDNPSQLLQKVNDLKERLGVPTFTELKRLEHSYAAFLQSFDRVIEQLASFMPITTPTIKGNRVRFSLEEIAINREELLFVVEKMTNYIEVASNFIKDVNIHAENLTRTDEVLLSEWVYWVRELKIKAGEWVKLFTSNNNEENVVWLERDNRSIPGSIVINKQSFDAVSVIEKLRDSIQMECAGIIWTSATLSIKGHERFIPTQLGIKESIPLIKYDAPGDFYKGAELFIVNDMPDIQQVTQSDYIEAVAHAVIQSVMATGGRLFVLFTSMDMLRKTYELIIESQQLEDYTLFAQGISSGSRMKLLKSFRQFDNSVLFGTNSFWEGVDVPGKALTAIIIVRLPFSAPSEPIYKARAAKLAASGLNPFTEYALPEAVMRLRQGFGRLIRTSDDKGFFIILDRRIETKSYGEIFLESLPSVRRKNVSLEQLVNELENCYTK